MTTSIDTNIIVALWWQPHPANETAAKLLHLSANLTICAPVYCELLADPAHDEKFLNEFLWQTSISVDWSLEEQVWLEAGRAYRSYVQRRRSSGERFPRRILADFLIGAHAAVRGYALLTFDRRLYSAAFPKLKIISE